MPRSMALRMAAMDALSSCGPQAKAQLPPPMAHAPNPIGVSHISELPSCLNSIVWLPVASIFPCGYLFYWIPHLFYGDEPYSFAWR